MLLLCAAGIAHAQEFLVKSDNGTFSGNESTRKSDDLIEWGKKLWETKLEDGLTLIDRAIKTHIITSHYGLPRLKAGQTPPAHPLHRAVPAFPGFADVRLQRLLGVAPGGEQLLEARIPHDPMIR